MELVGIGDLHLDKMCNLVPNALKLQGLAVERVLRYALKNGVKNIVFYGDICERPRMSYEAQVLFYSLLLKEEYSELDFHVILGNHDFAEDGTHSLQVLCSVCEAVGRRLHVYTKQTRTLVDKVPFNFLPYPFTTTVKDAINVGHFEVAGSLRDNGKQIEEGSSSKHTTLMGHLHTKHRVRNTHFSGTLYQTNFGEVADKFFHHVRATSPRPADVDVSCIPFKPPWTLVNLTVRSQKDLQGLSDDPLVLYKLYLKDGADVDIDRVLTKHPNIVKHNVFKTKTDLAQLVQQSWDFSGDVLNDVVNVGDDGTNRELLTQLGWSDRKIDRAVAIIDKLKGNDHDERNNRLHSPR